MIARALFILLVSVLSLPLASCSFVPSGYQSVEEVALDFDAQWESLPETRLPGDFRKTTIRFNPFTESRAFVVWTPHNFSFRTDIPSGESRLDFSFGILPDRTLKDGEKMTFTVSVNGKKYFSRSLRHRSGHRWCRAERASVGLSRFRGSEAEISFDVLCEDPELQLSAFWYDISIKTATLVRKAPASPETPNIIILLADTLRADHLGCYGYERGISPEIDRFAEKSVVFDNAFSVATWTWPSVGSLFTGLTPYRHGVYDLDRSYLEHHFDTLPEHFQRNGYSTAGFSANYLVSAKFNFSQGFGVFEEYNAKDAPAGFLNRRFTEWLRKNRGYSFFAFLHYMDPHFPYRAPDGHFCGIVNDTEKALKAIEEYPGFGGRINQKRDIRPSDYSDVQTFIDLYDEEIQYLDTATGKLLAELEQSGALDNTIVILLADHGEEFLDHGWMKHGLNLYNETLRIPLIVYYPEKLKPERKTDRVSILDIYPTLCELAGTEFSQSLQGKPLPLFNPSPADRQLLLSTYLARDPAAGRTLMNGLLRGPWKLIYTPFSNRLELYNLEFDPLEKTDVAFELREMADTMLKDLLAIIRSQTEQTPEDKQLDSEDRKKLRALGYL